MDLFKLDLFERFATDEDEENKQNGKLPTSSLQIRNIKVAVVIDNQNVKVFLNAIKSLNFTNNTELQFEANQMKYIAEESQYFQACAYFHTNFFQLYRFVLTRVPYLSCGLNFDKFVDFFLAITDTSLSTTSLKMVYYGDDLPMAFIFTQTDVEGANDNDISKLAVTQASNNCLDSPRTQESEEDDGFDMQFAGLIRTEYVITVKRSINPIDFNAMPLKEISKIIVSSHQFLSGFDLLLINLSPVLCIGADKYHSRI